jgi:hypothetical protein
MNAVKVPNLTDSAHGELYDVIRRQSLLPIL